MAIVEAYRDPNIIADLKTFDAFYGLPDAPNVTVMSQTGGSVSKIKVNAGWASETELDVEWAHTVSPGANLIIAWDDVKVNLPVVF